jgi:cytochrome c oxidase assembly factor CtaG
MGNYLANSNHLFGGSLVLTMLIVTVILLILVFELAMFVDVLRNDGMNSNRKIAWCIGMLLLHPFVAIVYYYTDRKISL